jgi:hypothetical protein
MSPNKEKSHPVIDDSPEDRAALLEQYKLYVEMADRVSNRRIEINKFYISLLSGLLVLLSIVSIPAELQNGVLVAVSALSVGLCFLWIVNIRSYKELNALKFKVIEEMEQRLPFRSYTREWELLKQGPDQKSYFRLTRIEQYVPLLLLVPYLVILIYLLTR